MFNLEDIGITKNCQSNPNKHASIFEEQIFWKMMLKNWFFQKCQKYLRKKFSKNFSEFEKKSARNAPTKGF